MATRILLISSGSGFMVDALKSNLKKTGFLIVQSEPEVQSIEAAKDETDLILVFAGEYVYNSADALVYLMDISRDEERPVCLINLHQEGDQTPLRREIRCRGLKSHCRGS